MVSSLDCVLWIIGLYIDRICAALNTLGVPGVQHCFVAPMATGMSLTLIFLAIRQEKPAAKFVIWSRIDQKSCFKSITTAGFEPIVVAPVLIGDELCTDVGKIESLMKDADPDSIACVLTTTSCFAPRASDDVESVAVLCRRYDVAHVCYIQINHCLFPHLF